MKLSELRKLNDDFVNNGSASRPSAAGSSINCAGHFEKEPPQGGKTICSATFVASSELCHF